METEALWQPEKISVRDVEGWILRTADPSVASVPGADRDETVGDNRSVALSPYKSARNVSAE